MMKKTEFVIRERHNCFSAVDVEQDDHDLTSRECDRLIDLHVY